MTAVTDFTPATVLPTNFRIDEVDKLQQLASAGAISTPTLGPLAAFTGTFSGSGFNTIFRPDNTKTPTKLPKPVTSDNILELNLTTETLSFTSALGSVPNRGFAQGDIFLNGVPYLQTVNDVTIQGQSVGIHFEPGLWMAIPSTQDPAEGQTFARMASIPHGTTIAAQGASKDENGPPIIPSVDITPFATANNAKIPFPSQTAAAEGTPRIPQDLSSFISSGRITQAMLSDPNTVLRNTLQRMTALGQKILSTSTITISTAPAAPLFGGGTDNIAFLLGDATATKPNAQSARMSATFWIETVEHTITVPASKAGETLTVSGGEALAPGHAAPMFILKPPHPIPTPIQMKVTFTQIQYSQVVLLNFNGLSWPHVSVATLTPSQAVAVPPTAWS